MFSIFLAVFVCLLAYLFSKNENFTADPKVYCWHSILRCNICCLSVLLIVKRVAQVAQWKPAGPHKPQVRELKPRSAKKFCYFSF